MTHACNLHSSVKVNLSSELTWAISANKRNPIPLLSCSPKIPDSLPLGAQVRLNFPASMCVWGSMGLIPPTAEILSGMPLRAFHQHPRQSRLALCCETYSSGNKAPSPLQWTHSKNKKEACQFWSLGFWTRVPGNLAYPDRHSVPTAFPTQDWSIYQESFKRLYYIFVYSVHMDKGQRSTG